MNSQLSVTSRQVPLLIFIILTALNSACSDDGGAPPLPATQVPIVTEKLAVPEDTPVPTTRVAPSTTDARRGATPSPTSTVSLPVAVKESPTGIVPTPVPMPTISVAPTAASGVGDVRKGGTLNLVNRQTVPHFDVHEDVSSALAAWGPGIVYSRMMRFRGGSNTELPSLAVECEVCGGWEMVDGRTFEFRLRDDVFWQDLQPVAGRRLAADDIAYSYERQRADGRPNGALLHIVDTVAAPEPGLLSITLLAPDADFLGSLADGHSKIVAREAVEVNGDLRTGPTVGTGAWVLEGAEEGSTFDFARNENYFKAGAPVLERIRIHTITDGDTAYAAFRVNNVDVHQLRPEEWEEFRRQKPDAAVLPSREIGVGMDLGFNTAGPLFGDARVRRAAMLAMRPNRAIEEVWHGAAYLTQGVPLGRADWWLGEEELNGYFGDPGQATALLADAVDELPVAVVIKAGDFGGEYGEHAERIAGEMRSVGFDTELELVDRRRFGEEVWLGGDYQMFVGPMAPVASPNAYMLAVLSSDGAWNTTGHRDEELDRLIIAQAGEYDPEERRRLVLEVQRIAMERAYRFMPAAAVSLWAWWPHVRGLEPNFAGSEYSHWERVWIER